MGHVSERAKLERKYRPDARTAWAASAAAAAEAKVEKLGFVENIRWGIGSFLAGAACSVAIPYLADADHAYPFQLVLGLLLVAIVLTVAGLLRFTSERKLSIGEEVLLHAQPFTLGIIVALGVTAVLHRDDIPLVITSAAIVVPLIPANIMLALRDYPVRFRIKVRKRK